MYATKLFFSNNFVKEMSEMAHTLQGCFKASAEKKHFNFCNYT